MELSFKELPFVPVEGQVIYVEQKRNTRLDKFIRDNYDWLKAIFRDYGLEFCFLPLLAEEAVCYNAPYLSATERGKRTCQVPSLAEYLAEGSLKSPCLVFGLNIPVKDANGNTVLQALPIKTKWYTSTKPVFIALAKEIRLLSGVQGRRYQEAAFRSAVKELAVRKYEEFDPSNDPGYIVLDNDYELEYGVSESRIPHSAGRFSRRDTDVKFSVEPSTWDTDRPTTKAPEEADATFDSQSLLLIDEIRQRINALAAKGVNTMFLHDLIDEGQHLSRLRITKDHRIILVDYNNLEVKMALLPKSVFMLFLRHPEGIRFKYLADYYAELLHIYLSMNPKGSRQKQEQSIRDITDPFNNSINEKCARIREAFVSNFDDRLARNYYITGKCGEEKRIRLDASMVLWDE